VLGPSSFSGYLSSKSCVSTKSQEIFYAEQYLTDKNVAFNMLLPCFFGLPMPGLGPLPGRRPFLDSTVTNKTATITKKANKIPFMLSSHLLLRLRNFFKD